MSVQLSCLNYLLCPLGTAGLAVAQQIYNRFKLSGKTIRDGDIGIVDGTEYHYYQVRLQSIGKPEVLTYWVKHLKPGW